MALLLPTLPYLTIPWSVGYGSRRERPQGSESWTVDIPVYAMSRICLLQLEAACMIRLEGARMTYGFLTCFRISRISR